LHPFSLRHLTPESQHDAATSATTRCKGHFKMFGWTTSLLQKLEYDKAYNQPATRTFTSTRVPSDLLGFPQRTWSLFVIEVVHVQQDLGRSSNAGLYTVRWHNQALNPHYWMLEPQTWALKSKEPLVRGVGDESEWGNWDSSPPRTTTNTLCQNLTWRLPRYDLAWNKVPRDTPCPTPRPDTHANNQRKEQMRSRKMKQSMTKRLGKMICIERSRSPACLAICECSSKVEISK